MTIRDIRLLLTCVLGVVTVGSATSFATLVETMRWQAEIGAPVGYVQFPVAALLQVGIGLLSVFVAVVTLIKTRNGQTLELKQAVKDEGTAVREEIAAMRTEVVEALKELSA